MTEVEITRKQIIVVGEVGENSYGDLTFTDKEGKEYKVGTKRRQYFDDVILPGVAVQLNYSKYRGNEYIYNANRVEDKLPDNPQHPIENPLEVLIQAYGDALQSKSGLAHPVKDSEAPKVEHKSSPETGMWWGQMGEMLRCGDIDTTTPEGKALRNAYYAEMLRVLGVKIKEVPIK